MGLRRRAREAALQVLHQLDANEGLEPALGLALYFEHFEGDPAARPFCEELVLGTWGHRPQLDELIQAASRNWRVERMACVDRNLLRLATFELAHRRDVPARVALNEAIEIAKRYGTAESPAFVNGVLDKVTQELGR